MQRKNERSFGGMRIIIGLVLAVFSLYSYFSSGTYNPITEETQYVALTPPEEIALGQEAVPEMAAQHDGFDHSQQDQQVVDDVCNRLLNSSVAGDTVWQFECHLLADTELINAFALPGGQLFITRALYNQLETEGQLAGVMGHEIAHVIARHGAQRIAKQELTQGLSGAAVMATYDPDNPNSARTAQFTALIGNMVNLQYGREDELQSDELGVQFMVDAGYDPRAMIGVMQILAEAGGSGGQPEFFSTHPNPDNRIERIQQEITEIFPNGVPSDLTP